MRELESIRGKEMGAGLRREGRKQGRKNGKNEMVGKYLVKDFLPFISSTHIYYLFGARNHVRLGYTLMIIAKHIAKHV